MSAANGISEKLSEAMELHRNGDLQPAEQIYRDIVMADPNQADAWHLLGFLALQTNRFPLADKCLSKAVRLRPEEGEFHSNLSLARFARKQTESAVWHAAEAERFGYRDPAGYMHLGVELYQIGDLDTAAACLREAMRLDPNSADLHNYLGIVHKASEQFDEAAHCFARAIQLNPNHVAALNNLGNTWRDQGDPETALIYYNKALQQDPRFAAAHNNMGVAWERAGEVDKAIDCYERACELDPGYAEAWSNLGNAFRSRGDFHPAVECLRRALDANPQSAEIRNNFGIAQRSQKDLEGAIATFRKVLEQRPDSVETLNNLGSALTAKEQLTDAAQCYNRIAELRPEQPLWRLRVATLCPAVFSSHSEVDRYWEGLQLAMAALAERSFPMDTEEFLTEAPQAPFNLQFFSHNLRDIKRRYADLFHARLVAIDRTLGPLDCKLKRGQRPHIGIVVTGGHEGVFLKSLRGLLERINTDRFRLSVFCGLNGKRQLESVLRDGSIRVVDLPNQLVPAAHLLRNQECHLLYYWEVGTDATNYFLPFLRLAPTQCTSWGIQVTTGIPGVDYYLSSALVEPEDGQTHYSEQLVLATTLLCYRRRSVLEGPPRARATWGFATDDHLYVCAHQMGKYHPDFDSMLAEILRRDSVGKVVAIADGHGKKAQMLRRRFAETLPDVLDRVVFLPRLDMQQYLGLLSAADVLLDPPHFSGVNTTYESFAMNRPVVTLPSSFHRGRYTFGCYRKMGLDTCIAEDEQHYAEIAVRIASDSDFQQAVTQEIRETSGVLFEDMDAVREHERIFAELIDAAQMQ